MPLVCCLCALQHGVLITVSPHRFRAVACAREGQDPSGCRCVGVDQAACNMARRGAQGGYVHIQGWGDMHTRTYTDAHTHIWSACRCRRSGRLRLLCSLRRVHHHGLHQVRRGWGAHRADMWLYHTAVTHGGGAAQVPWLNTEVQIHVAHQTFSKHSSTAAKTVCYALQGGRGTSSRVSQRRRSDM